MGAKYVFNPLTGNLDTTDVVAFNGEVNLGTAAAPSVFFTGDTNTGIYSPGADQVALSTNGTGRLFVDANGNVGVGTTNPGTNLQVQGSGTCDIRIRSAGASAPTSLQFWARNSADNAVRQSHIIGTESGLSFATATTNNTTPTERLRVDTSTGNVGIGTSSPISRLTCASVANDWAGSFGAQVSQNQYTGISLGYGPSSQYHKGAIAFIRTDATNGAGDLAFCLGSTSNATNVAIEDEKVRITSTGRVGIGTTSPDSLLDLQFANSRMRFEQESGSNRPVIRGTRTTDKVNRNISLGGSEITFLIGSASTSALTSADEKARIDSSGRLLVGTSSAVSIAGSSAFIQHHGNKSTANIGIAGYANNLGGPILAFGASRSTTVGTPGTIVSSGDILGDIRFAGDDGTDINTISASIRGEVDGTPGANDIPGRLVFSTTANGASSPTAGMQIKNTRELDIYSNGGTAVDISSQRAAAINDYFIAGRYSATAFVSGTVSFYVSTNGNVYNTNNSYGAISDIKLKENIVDASSQWDNLKALRVRKYNFKEGQTHTQIGLVAQEVELVCPGLVSESPDRDEDGSDLGTVTKSVNYSVLYMKAVKALQEAMERIETLEAKVAALEAQ